MHRFTPILFNLFFRRPNFWPDLPDPEKLSTCVPPETLWKLRIDHFPSRFGSSSLCTSQLICIIHPTPAPYTSGIELIRYEIRIDSGITFQPFQVIFMILIHGPLRYVASHIVEAKGVRFFCTNLIVSPVTVLCIPLILV